MINKKIYNGYIQLALAQCCIGANIILGKDLVPEHPIFPLLLIRFTIGFIIIAIYQSLKNLSKVYSEINSLSKKEWGILFAQALCAGFLFNILTLNGLEHTTATVTGIINSAIPALVAIFSYFILREKINSQMMIAIFLCVFGISILGIGKAIPTDSNKTELLGIFFVLLALIPEALFTILAKLLKKPLTPLTTTLLMNFFNMILLIPFTIFTSWGALIHLTPLTVLKIFLYGISGGILFFVFWYQGLKSVSASTAGLFMGIMPISTCLLAYFFLNETLGMDDLIGMIFVIISIFIGTRARKQPDNFKKIE